MFPISIAQASQNITRSPSCRLGAFAGMNGVETQFLFLLCLAGKSSSLSERVLSCQTAHFLALWLARTGFYWYFFLSTPNGIWFAGFFSCKSDIFEAKRKPRELTTVSCLAFKFPDNLPFSHQFVELCYVCFLYNVQGFWMLLAAWIGKSMSTPS